MHDDDGIPKALIGTIVDAIVRRSNKKIAPNLTFLPAFMDSDSHFGMREC